MVKPKVKRVVESATPQDARRRLVVIAMPAAAPTLSRGADPRIAFWFGVLKMAMPSPESASGRMILGIEALRVREAMKNCPSTITLVPIVQRKREPNRSESRPANGATITITTELAIMIQPILEGEKPMMLCR